MLNSTFTNILAESWGVDIVQLKQLKQWESADPDGQLTVLPCSPPLMTSVFNVCATVKSLDIKSLL